jgi:regulatory protein
MPKITNIIRSKRKRDFVNIYLDDKYWLSCPEGVVTDNMLFMDKEISEEEVSELAKKALLSKYYYKTINLLSIRPRSEWEIKTKLREYRLKDKDSIEDSLWDIITSNIISKLVEAKYIDDERFARWFIDSRLSQKKKSWREIEQGLFQKGIENKVMSQLKEEYSEKIKDYEREAIQKFSSRKLKGKTYEDINKFKQYLYSKGFSIDTINEEVDSATKN